MKRMILAVALAFWIISMALPGSARSAVLTIGDGAVMLVYGGASVSLHCQDVLIEAGGSIGLEWCYSGPGFIYGARRVTVQPGGDLSEFEGKVYGCTIIPSIMLLLMD